MTDKLNLCIQRDDSYKGRTNVYHVYSAHSEVLLGIIKWNCAWRCYWLETEPDCGWSYECLNEVSKFIKELMDKRKMK